MVKEEAATTDFSNGGSDLPATGTKVGSSCETSRDADGQSIPCDNDNKCSDSLDEKSSVKEGFASESKDAFAFDTKPTIPEKGIALDVEATCDDGSDGGDEKSDDATEEDDGLPIDRGWAWMILAGSFLNIILVVGYGRSIGILFVEYLKIFEASATKTTLFMGVMAATFSIASLFCMNLILQILGVRKTVVLGGAISSVGMLTAVFATSITFLICTHSILIGIGHSMIHGPALVLIGQYFRKRRGLATSIAMSGVSLGGSIFPPIVRYFLDEFGVRGSMLLFTGLTMNIMVCGLLFRPLESFRKRVTKERHRVDSLKSQVDVEAKELIEGRDNTDKDLKDPLLSSDTGNKKEDINSETQVLKRVRSLSVHSTRESNPGNLSHIPLNIYRSNPELTSLSILNITEESIKAKKSERQKNMCDYLKLAVVSLDFSLFKYPMFQLIIVTSCFAVVFALVGVYLPALAKEKGVPLTETSLLLTIYSSVDFFSRLAVGYIADLKRIKVHHLMTIGLVLGGTVTHFTTFYNSFGLMVLCSVLFGLFGSFYNCLIPVFIIEFMGQKHMAKVLGFVAVFHGLTMAVTHPILGSIRDLTGSYQICFNYIGACDYLAAFFLLCEPLVRQRARKLKLLTDQEDQEELEPKQN